MKYLYVFFAIASGELVEALRAIHAPWWTCLVLAVAAFAVAIVLIEIRDKSVETARQLKEQIDTQNERVHQRISEEAERQAPGVAEEFRLFARLGIAPTDEWRLRAAKVWGVPTPKELDEEWSLANEGVDDPNELGSPDEDWEMRAAMLPGYRSGRIASPGENIAEGLRGVLEQILLCHRRLPELLKQGADIQGLMAQALACVAEKRTPTSQQVSSWADALRVATEVTVECSDRLTVCRRLTENTLKEMGKSL